MKKIKIFALCIPNITHLDASIFVKMAESSERILIKAERLLFPVVLPPCLASTLCAIKLITKVREIELWF